MASPSLATSAPQDRALHEHRDPEPASAVGAGARYRRILSLAYLIVSPPAGDLAAATYRSELFARVGFTLRDNGWYAIHGHYLPGYSLLSPALGALLGVRVVLALSAHRRERAVRADRRKGVLAPGARARRRCGSR